MAEERPKGRASKAPSIPSGRPAKGGRLCASCTSPHRAEIDRRLLRGEPTRAIAAWLERDHGVRLHHDALGRHKRAHCNPGPRAVKEKLTATHVASRKAVEDAQREKPSTPATEEFAAEVEAQIANTAAVDDAVAVFMRAMRATSKAVVDAKGNATFGQASLLTGGVKAVAQAAATRHSILNGRLLGQRGQKAADDAVAGLRDLVANATPPVIEGDDVDDTEEEDLLERPRWGDGEPDGEPDREVVEVQASVEAAPSPAAAKPHAMKLWAPPVG